MPRIHVVDCGVKKKGGGAGGGLVYFIDEKKEMVAGSFEPCVRVVDLCETPGQPTRLNTARKWGLAGIKRGGGKGAAPTYSKLSSKGEKSKRG